MAGNSADPFGDYDDAEYDVSDTEEEDLDSLDGDMSGPDFEDVIPVGQGHWYCLVDSMGLERYYQTKQGSSSSSLAPTPCQTSLHTTTSSLTIPTIPYKAFPPPPAPGTMP